MSISSTRNTSRWFGHKQITSPPRCRATIDHVRTLTLGKFRTFRCGLCISRRLNFANLTPAQGLSLGIVGCFRLDRSVLRTVGGPHGRKG